MSNREIHTRILMDAAREILKPLGLFQKGHSRTWLDDRRWYLINVEFQPGWGRGSYLNVGVMWLAYAKNFLCFDVGYRVREFVEFEDESQFRAAALQLASDAAERVRIYRGMFRTVEDAAQYLLSLAPKSIWWIYHTGVASGYIGDTGVAERCFKQIKQLDPQTDWEIDLQQKVIELEASVRDTAHFREVIEGVIHEARRQLKMKAVDDLHMLQARDGI